MSELDVDVRVAILRIFRSPEFGHYADYKSEVEQRIEQDAEEINEAVFSARYEYGVADSWLIDWDELVGLVLRALAYVSVTITVLVTANHLWTSSPADLSWLDGLVAYKDWLAGAFAGVFVVLCVVIGRFARWRIIGWRAQSGFMDEAFHAYQAWLASEVRGFVSQAINELLGPRGVVAFPTYAPRLIELDTSTIAPSATVNQVKEFIEGHESSAIGLAGNRGSGKSTVLRALTQAPELSPFVTIVTSPVKYDAGEFLRRLLHAVAGTINLRANADDDEGDDDVRRHGRRGRLKAILSGLAGVAGLAIVLIKTLPVQPMLSRIDPVFVLGCALLAAALAGMFGMLAGRMSGSRTTSLPPDVRRARELIHMLQWEVEQGTNLKTTVKVHNVFDTSAENTRKDKSRTLSHAELVVALHELLHLFVQHNYPKKRLVVCIDELDKLDQPEHLVSVVNELKDVFHIRGVHFVVTVSTDALSSFESRGLADRDAFDSAFDTVVSTRWLTVDESINVIGSRAAGFAGEIAKFCHAWSGGLVRDLLRAARKAVELQKAADRALTVSEIVSGLVLDDLCSATQASLRNLASEDKDVDALWELHCMLERARDSTTPGREAVAALSFSNETFEVLKAKVLLGLYLVDLAGSTDQADGAIERVGTAIGRISGPRPMREAAVAAAVPDGPL
uniref:KAP NTPase domain-containing protein n=1 Tax=uncultured soil bacterium TaxID=164851 RepID=E2D2I5_9BACT|nr:hypothetical protein [uncultured soil bacterium]